MWIYENESWPVLIWDLEELAPKLTNLRYQQGRLLGRLESLGLKERKEATLNTLSTNIVKSSAIEGEILNLEEVRSSIARKLGLEAGGLVPVSRNVEGLVEMMLDATQNYSKPLTAERLFAWHAALFPTGYSGLYKITVANWRREQAGAMEIVSGALGAEKVHYQAPAANRLEQEMKAFLKWFEEEQEIDPVLKAGIAHFWFVTIHPFEDGNGRIARAIADLSLARSDRSSERFYSMSGQIERERKVYYQELEKQQRNGLNLTVWLSWFLGCLERALKNTENDLSVIFFKTKFWNYANKQGALNQRQRKVLARMLENFKGHLNTSKYTKLGKCSQDTALRDIKELNARGLLIQNSGRGRSTSYRLPDEQDFKE